MKYFLMLFMSALFLTACGSNGEEDTAEAEPEAESGAETSDEDAVDAESDTESAAGEEATEEDNDTAGEESDSSTAEEATEEDEAEGTAEEEAAVRDIDFSIIDEQLEGGDGTEISVMFELNSGIADQLANASESDAAMEEVLMPVEDVTTYYAETFMLIHAFGGEPQELMGSDVAGLTAELDEREDIEVYSEGFDTTTGELIPNAYGNAEDVFGYETGQWMDYSEAATSDEIYHAYYSNMHEAFMESEDVINVSEDDDYYYLHNIGTEAVLDDNFGSLFNVEYTNADLNEMENAVVGIVDKSTQELFHVAYISTAPGFEEGEQLHIEIASSFDDYGSYDADGITVPDIYE